MPATLTLASILQGRSGLRLIRRSFEEGDDIAFDQTAPLAEDAPVEEEGPFRAIRVAQAEASGFTHFLDGAQKARIAFYDGFYPGYLAHLSAAVLRREDREMSAPSDEASLLAVFAPQASEALAELARAGFEVRSVSCSPEAGMAGMADEIKTKIGTVREELECDLAMRCLKDSGEDEWLLADGGIAQICSHMPGFERIAGVVKSHRKQYFASRETSQIVLGLKECERTSVFRARTGPLGKQEAFSWYLRLREDPGELPAFGLIRVELPAVGESIAWADKVSSWLLAERLPLSLPDRRFDRLLYPIRRVELYLRSKQPSDAVLAAHVGVV